MDKAYEKFIVDAIDQANALAVARESPSSAILGGDADQLTDHQRDAVDALWTRWIDGGEGLATLAGSAGTGKTFVVATLVKMLRKIDPRAMILLAAPTHRATGVLAARVRSSVRVERFDRQAFKDAASARVGAVFSASAQSALGVRMTGDDFGQLVGDYDDNGMILGQFDYAIIDEASMLDREMVERIVHRKRQCSVLFVGDFCQLPPVSIEKANDESETAITDPTTGTATSLVFDAAMVPAQFSLTEIVRQQLENPIVRIGEAARRRIMANEDFTYQDVLSNFNPGNADDRAHMSIRKQKEGLIGVAQVVVSAMGSGIDARALLFTNAHVIKTNELIHDMLFPARDKFCPGEPLVAYEPFEPATDTGALLVQNSQEMKIEGVERMTIDCDGGKRLVDMITARLADQDVLIEFYQAVNEDRLKDDLSRLFANARELKRQKELAKREGRTDDFDRLRRAHEAALEVAWITRRRYPRVRHAYAMTIHKSQGTTLEAAVIYWPSLMICRQPADRSRLAYVALTRTSKYTVITR